jgi:Ca2+-binding RTX toxin-like protein
MPYRWRCRASSDGADDVRGGDGRDRADYNAAAQVWRVSLDGVENDGAPGENDSLTAFETLVGTNQDDVLTGDAEENMIVGLDGADVIDSVDGVSGNDWVDGGDGEQDVCRTDSGDPAQNCER